jgi:hypothetical protein
MEIKDDIGMEEKKVELEVFVGGMVVEKQQSL